MESEAAEKMVESGTGAWYYLDNVRFRSRKVLRKAKKQLWKA